MSKKFLTWQCISSFISLTGVDAPVMLKGYLVTDSDNMHEGSTKPPKMQNSRFHVSIMTVNGCVLQQALPRSGLSLDSVRVSVIAQIFQDPRYSNR
jgi:hypothetical protein